MSPPSEPHVTHPSHPPHIGRLLRQIQCLDETNAGEVCVTNTVLKCLQDQMGTSLRSEEVCAGVHKVNILNDVGDAPPGLARKFVAVTDMDTAFRFIPEMFHATIRKKVYWIAGKCLLILILNQHAVRWSNHSGKFPH